MARGSILKAAIMGGALSALVSALAYTTPLSCCCCLVVAGGGLFAAWVIQADTEGQAGGFRCAAAGLLSGGAAGLACLPLAALLAGVAFGPGHVDERLAEAQAMYRQMDIPSDLMAGTEGLRRTLIGPEINAWTPFAMVFMSVIFSFFGLLGGLLGAKLFRSRRAPPALARAAGPGSPPSPPVPPGDVSRTAETAGMPADVNGAPEAPAPTEEEGELAPDELPAFPPAPPGPPPDDDAPTRS